MRLFNGTKLYYLLIVVLAASLIGARRTELASLTIRNKSGQQIAVRLITPDHSVFYYLTVPANEPHTIVDKTFTITKTAYAMRLYYYLPSDPATGYECPEARNTRLVAGRNIRITVTPCFRLPLNRGEPTQIKFGRWRCVR